MKNTIGRLRDKLGADPVYFQKVYNHTFDFARSAGQRSLGDYYFDLFLTDSDSIPPYVGIDTAEAFWSTLLPHGLHGGALSHMHTTDEDQDDDMGEGDGWQ